PYIYHLCYRLYFSHYVTHRDLHSFPTRRSSDLSLSRHCTAGTRRGSTLPKPQSSNRRRPSTASMRPWLASIKVKPPRRSRARARSEEHTSELQSRGHLVCRLLLEKKNVN